MFFDCKYRLKSDDELSLNEKKNGLNITEICNHIYYWEFPSTTC